MTLWVVEAGIGNTPTYSLISEGSGVKPGRMFTAIWKLGMIAVNKLLQLGCLNDFTVVDPESCATPQEIRRLTVVLADILHHGDKHAQHACRALLMLGHRQRSHTCWQALVRLSRMFLALKFLHMDFLSTAA